MQRKRNRGRTLGLCLLASGLVACGAGPRWPKVQGVAQQQATAVRSIDLLPVDVQLWTYPGSPHEPNATANSFHNAVHHMVRAGMARRGYDVAYAIDWDGAIAVPGGRRQMISADELMATSYALSGYGTAQERWGQDGLLVPHLPTRLGHSTNSDATLYIGGWAYVGKDKRRKSTGEKVAIGVLLGVAIVGVIALAVASKGKGGKLLGGAGKAVAKGASAAGKGVARVVRATSGFGRVIGSVARGAVRTVGRATISAARNAPRIAFEALDAFGRSNTHIDFYVGRPDWPRVTRRRAGRSQLMLEMTLVDNHSGKALWHARQRFPARPHKPRDVKRAIDKMLSTLPAHYQAAI